MNRCLYGFCAIAFCFCIQPSLATDTAVAQRQDKDSAKPLKELFDQMEKQIQQLREENAKLLTELRLFAKKMAERDLRSAESLQQVNAAILEAKLKVTEADLKRQRAEEVVAKLRTETEALAKALQRSEQDKLALQEAVNKYRKESVEIRNERDASAERNKNLAEIIRQKDKVIQELAQGRTPKPIVADPNASNPPAAKVKGTITEVRNEKDPKETLVKLSVGTDQGVNKSNTLIVYRTEPTPQYLGEVRIVEASKTESVGRLLNRGKVVTLKVGDIVVDNLDP
jgi:hypothetical protein